MPIEITIDPKMKHAPNVITLVNESEATVATITMVGGSPGKRSGKTQVLGTQKLEDLVEFLKTLMVETNTMDSVIATPLIPEAIEICNNFNNVYHFQRTMIFGKKHYDYPVFTTQNFN